MKMKKFINAPETITDEELAGMGLAYADILDVDGHLVISKDLAAADRIYRPSFGFHIFVDIIIQRHLRRLRT